MERNVARLAEMIEDLTVVTAATSVGGTTDNDHTAPIPSALPFRSALATPSRSSRFVSEPSYTTPHKESDNPEWSATSDASFSFSTATPPRFASGAYPTGGHTHGSPRRNPGRVVSSKIDDHIYTRGFLEGACSDVTISAFGKSWHLHRIILDRSPFFGAMFSGCWRESDAREHRLQFDDENITLDALEFVLARIYGRNGAFELVDCLAVLAAAAYLDLEDLIDQCCQYQLRTLSADNVARVMRFVSGSCEYGRSSERLREACRALLLRDGWEMTYEQWRGVPAEFVVEIVSHDAFYCPSEMDRYLFISGMLHNRQNDATEGGGDGARAAEAAREVEILHAALCEDVHYMHMTQAELKRIRADGIVDENVLFRALWNQMDLQEHVATADGPVIGITQPSQTAYPVPYDDTCYIGDPLLTPPSSGGGAHSAHGGSSSSGGVSGQSGSGGTALAQCYSHFPPFRFCAEFDRVGDLKEDTRVYSQTVFYAGSYWNIYIHNKVRARKSRQLGVYLHRVEIKPNEPSPITGGQHAAGGVMVGAPGMSADTAPERVSAIGTPARDRDRELGSRYATPHATVATVSGGRDRSSVLFGPSKDAQAMSGSGLGAFGGASSSSVSSPGEMHRKPYVDHRSTISTYFKIYCPSRRGTSKVGLTEFRSAPDEFHRSQSWGWKSRGLCAYDEREGLEEGSELGNLRFMIVLGVV